MQSINVTFQVIGVLLVGPLFKTFRPTYVLAFACTAWGLVMLTIPILEAAPGGRPPSMF